MIKYTFNRMFFKAKPSQAFIPVSQSRAPIEQKSRSWHWDELLRHVGILADKTNGVIFDIGAHWGESVLKFRELWPSAVIYSFEPFSESLQRLTGVVGNDDKVQILPFAVAAQSGKRLFHPTNYSAANSLLEIDPAINRWADSDDLCNQETAIVEAISLDNFAEEKGIASIDLMKMDIQGGELDALKGAERLLAQQAINAIICEVEFIPLYKGQAYFWDVVAFMEEHHYHFVNFIEVKESNAGVLRWADALFVSARVWQLIQDAHRGGNWEK